MKRKGDTKSFSTSSATADNPDVQHSWFEEDALNWSRQTDVLSVSSDHFLFPTLKIEFQSDKKRLSHTTFSKSKLKAYTL